MLRDSAFIFEKTPGAAIGKTNLPCAGGIIIRFFNPILP
jgi:hypothetical protein